MTRRFSASAPTARTLSWLLLPLAALRLTRFITTDWLGEWTIDAPARRWANRHESSAWMYRNPPLEEQVDPDNGWRSKLVKGLDCPFCVGFWIGLLLIMAIALCPKPLRPILNSLLAALGLNYVVGHISKRID